MPLRFTLRQLEYFVAVGELGSILQASEKLHVSSPTISSAISQLEQEFGLSLFVRKHAKGLSLTEAGSQMLSQARKLLAEAEQLNDIAGDITQVVRGSLSIGCYLSFAQLIFPSLRRGFQSNYPDVRVTQFELNQSGIFDHIRGAKIDIALSYNLDIPADLEFLPLVELPPFVLVNEEHPLALSTSVSAIDLKDYAMVLLDLPHTSVYFTSFFSQIGIRPIIAERTHDMAVMRSLVANGFGYSIANLRPLNNLSPDGKIVRYIPLQCDLPHLQMGLVTAEGSRNSFTINAFVEHCKQAITASSAPGMNMV
ncbi:LysR family transcriptional regulator [Chromatiales bacterium (ex Bugula neritina AB1)]|nr:LysR family transcriptional regulator [Chromatiales bacterium (ex Bugula neritina AB1)]